MSWGNMAWQTMAEVRAKCLADGKTPPEIAKAIDGLVIDETITEYGIENANISEKDKEILRKFFNLD